MSPYKRDIRKHDDPEDESHEHNRRKMTLWDVIDKLSSWVAVGGAVLGLVLWFFDKLPIAKEPETSQKIEAVRLLASSNKDRVDQTSVWTLENLELTLVDAINKIDARLENLQRGSQEYFEWQQQRSRLQQRLDQVQIDLRNLRSPS